MVKVYKALAAFGRLTGFLLRVLGRFRQNQGLLLAGAIAFYTLLSIIPLLILILIVLSHFMDPEQLIGTMSTFLELAMPGYAAALTEQVRVFLRYRGVIGTVGILILLFFSSIAFSVLENAISVIFHRVRAQRRHFLISSIIPYLFILLITLGVLSLSFIVGALEPLESTRLVVFGHKFGLGFIFGVAVYVLGLVAEVLPDHGLLPGPARGAHHLPARAHRGAGRHDPVGNHPPRDRLVLQDLHLREPDLRLLRLGGGVPARRRGRGAHRPAGGPGHRGARARQRKNTLGIAPPYYLAAAALYRSRFSWQSTHSSAVGSAIRRFPEISPSQDRQMP